MKRARWWALPGAVGLAVSMTALTGQAALAHQGPAPRVALAGSLVPAQERAHPAGAVPAGSQVNFDLLLSMRNPNGAAAYTRQVSTPGSAAFHRYLTDAQWESRYGPSQAAVTKAESWLRQQGFTVGALARDHLFVSAHGPVSAVQHAFGVKLGYYQVNGHTVRLAKGTLTIPSSLAGVVAGAPGVNEYLDTSAAMTGARAPAAQAGGTPAAASRPAATTKEPGPPAGFRNPQPCSAYWGQKTDTKDAASLYKPYTYPEPYDICGYKPAQLRGAYQLAGQVAKGDDGKGVTIAIVDAYDSPALLADTQQYARQNDPKHPLTSSQFSNVAPARITNLGACGGNGWYGEQALDVESSHAMAPGAHIEYVGAKSCEDADLLSAVTSGASVVSNSWDDVTGDVFEDAAAKQAYDETFMLAASTGVSVLFCSHDYGDNFADFGLTGSNYPATSPYVTAVGGTALQVNAENQAQADYGWSTGHLSLCASKTTNCGSPTKPLGTLGYVYGSGGGTSYYYTEPWYQDHVVPADLTLRNEAVNGPVPYRVMPDISMDADIQTGMLIGLTQAFPGGGSHYSQYKIGGTSLASPLFAGVVADADQAAGTSLGFLNPVLYKAYTQTPAAFSDILAPAKPHSAAEIRVDYANGISASKGYTVTLETSNYEGPETYCDGTGNCATRNVSLTTTKGFDSMTGLGTIGSGFLAALSRF